MASITSASVTIPSFTSLKSTFTKTTPTTARIISTSTTNNRSKFAIKSSLRDAGAAAVIAAAASAMLAAGNAMALEVLLGGSDGSLAFVPSNITVASGEKITFKNNAGFPHNVIFDSDEVPSGVDADKISMSEEDLLNAPGEEYSVTLTEKGSYTVYCSPHQGAGMVGKITVN